MHESEEELLVENLDLYHRVVTDPTGVVEGSVLLVEIFRGDLSMIKENLRLIRKELRKRFQEAAAAEDIVLVAVTKAVAPEIITRPGNWV